VVKDAVKLVMPNAALEATHRDFVEEFRRHGEAPVPWVAGLGYARFDEYIASLEAASLGVGVRPGFVPHSTWWLVDDHDTIVAVANLRHELNERLQRRGGHIGFGVKPSQRGKGYATETLRLMLERARVQGLDKVLITCDKHNEASARTIVRNGGVWEADEFLPEFNSTVSRYWIALG